MKRIILLALPLLFAGCQEEVARSDAYGNFEATITTVSSEASGKLIYLDVAEGARLEAGQLVALVDTTNVHLQREQLLAQIASFGKRLQTAAPEISVFEDQKKNLIRERDRTRRLLDAKAATPRQLDELNGQIAVIDQQIAAAAAKISTANQNILAGRDPLIAQLDVINNQISKAYVYNPIGGTVLTKLAEPAEVVGMGSPLYRIARLDTLILRAYAGSVPLQSASVGQQVEVLIDAGEDKFETLRGTITWIASEAEFTPKTIQTKEERVNLVYAMKVAVPNPEGTLKLGMPAEVNFRGADAGEMEETK